MREYYTKRNVDPFSVLPLTFLVTNVNDQQFKKFEQHYFKLSK